MIELNPPCRALACGLALACFACDDSPPPDADADADADGDVEAGIEVEPPAPPALTPCPEGWVEVPADPADPYGYATCDPWPDGDPVTLPVLTPCPPGWREVPADPVDPHGYATCDPWPVTGHEDCEAVDEAHFPGMDACARVGSPCPAADWADDLPIDVPILFVREGEATVGDGTRELPFGLISDATTAAGPGTIIALSKGTFDEDVELGEGVTLWGACVAETLVTCSVVSTDLPTILVSGADTVLRGLRVGGDRAGVAVRDGGASVLVEGVVVEGAQGAGVMVDAGRATLRDLVVRDTRPAPDGTLGAGIDVGTGAQVDVTRAVIERNRLAAAYVGDAGTRVTLSDVDLRDTQARASDGAAGRGLNVQFGARVDVLRAVIERNRDVGVFAMSAGSEVTLTDVVVRDTQSREPERWFGRGLSVEAGAQVDAVRAVFERNLEVGVFAMDAGSVVTLTEVVVRDTRSRVDTSTWGRGLQAQTGARIEVTNAVIERNRNVGVLVAEGGAEVVAVDLLVRDTQSQEADGIDGDGLVVLMGGRVVASRAVFERNRSIGVLVSDEGSSAVLNAVVVRDTQSRESDGRGGRGLEVEFGAQVEVGLALFERNRDTSVFVATEGTALTLTDVVVRDTMGRESDLSFGRAMELRDSVDVQVSRALFERNREVAIYASGDGTTFALADAVVRDTQGRERDLLGGRGLEAHGGVQIDVRRAVIERSRDLGAAAFGEGTDVTMTGVVVRDTLGAEGGDAGGLGISSLGGAHIGLDRFLVTRSALCGLQLAHGRYLDDTGAQVTYDQSGTMDAREGEISENEVCGINVQVDDYDVDRLLDRVVFRDNEFNLDLSGDIYVPEVVLPDVDPLGDE
jgi:uncharacterized membrane protein (UPF0136 family)